MNVCDRDRLRSGTVKSMTLALFTMLAILLDSSIRREEFRTNEEMTRLRQIYSMPLPVSKAVDNPASVS